MSLSSESWCWPHASGHDASILVWRPTFAACRPQTRDFPHVEKLLSYICRTHRQFGERFCQRITSSIRVAFLPRENEVGGKFPEVFGWVSICSSRWCNSVPIYLWGIFHHANSERMFSLAQHFEPRRFLCFSTVDSDLAGDCFWPVDNLQTTYTPSWCDNGKGKNPFIAVNCNAFWQSTDLNLYFARGIKMRISNKWLIIHRLGMARDAHCCVKFTTCMLCGATIHFIGLSDGCMEAIPRSLTKILSVCFVVCICLHLTNARKWRF